MVIKQFKLFIQYSNFVLKKQKQKQNKTKKKKETFERKRIEQICNKKIQKIKKKKEREIERKKKEKRNNKRTKNICIQKQVRYKCKHYEIGSRGFEKELNYMASNNL